MIYKRLRVLTVFVSVFLSCKHEVVVQPTPGESENEILQPEPNDGDEVEVNHSEDTSRRFSTIYLRLKREQRDLFNADKPRTTRCSFFEPEFDIQKIYTSGAHNVCALSVDGDAKCFGFSSELYNSFLVQSYLQISVGSYSICVLSMDGELSCVGEMGSVVYQWLIDSGYDPLDPPSGRYSSFGSGISPMRCAINLRGEVNCWGKSVNLLPGDEPEVLFKNISVGSDQACGISIDNQLHCWGPEILADPFPEESFTFVDCSGRVCCGILEDSSAVCWSGRQREQDLINFEPVYDVPVGSYSKVCTGAYFACGLDQSGNVVCWGDELERHNRSALVVPRPDSGFLDIACGLHHVCGVDGDGGIICWGEDFEAGEDCPENLMFEDLGVRG